MENLKDKNLAFFMDLGSSLSEWNEVGFIDREIKIYNYLAKEFNKVFIFTYGDSSDLKFRHLFEKNVTIIVKKKKTKNPLCNAYYEFSLPFRYFKIIKSCYIFKTNQNLGTIGPTLAKIILPNSKLIVRSGYIGSINAKLYKLPIYTRLYLIFSEFISYFFCDNAFIPTKQNCDLLKKKYPFVKKKLIELNNCIDTQTFKKNSSLKVFDIIYVARLDKDKNHMGLLKSALGTKLKILFIGQGAEKEKIVDFASKENLDITIRDMIPNSDLPYWYNKAKICVFPSLHEGNPKSLLEAMSCELPVIGLPVMGVKNLIENGINGILTKDLSIESLRCEIKKMLDMKIETRENIGINARSYIENNFSADKIFEKELAIYKELLNN